MNNCTKQIVIFLLMGCVAAACGAMENEIVIEESATLPLAYEVDVLVVGGSLAGVEAACSASQKGANVLLLESRPYLGYDLCATQRLWLLEDEKPQTPLTEAIFGTGALATPGQVKSALDKALLNAGVQFLTGCYGTDVLFAAEGGVPAGIVMVNRSGRQVVRAKVIIDATKDAAMTRGTSAAFKPFTAGHREYRYIVVGGEPAPKLPCRKLPFTFGSEENRGKGKGKNHAVYEYTLKLEMADARFGSLNKAFHDARSATWTRDVVDSSECLFYIPGDTVVPAEKAPATWPGSAQVALGLFRPAKVESWFVLSAYAGLPRDQMEAALRPTQSAVIGRRIGEAAAAMAGNIPKRDRIDFAGKATPRGNRVVKEHLSGVRFSEKPQVRLSAHGLPVLGSYDVVVVGGGTSGAPAGIGSARSGAKTLVIEYLDELGGVGTAGLIGKYWYGFRNGFTKEIDEFFPGRWNVAGKAEWLRREILKAGGEIWFNSFGCATVMDDRKVAGVVVAGPFGRGVVLAKTVIDGTGNADLAAAAGADTSFSISSFGDLSVQIAGYPARDLGDGYNNTCYAMVDDTDLFDRWHLLLYGRQQRYQGAYDFGQLIDSRDRRRVVGDYVLTTSDILCGRTFPDTVCHHRSNFDAAAFPDSKMLLIKDMKGPVYQCDLPYRCLIPKGIEGLLVTGLGASTERDAMTLMRMQPDLQNQGYAAGLAAAMAARGQGHVRKINVKTLQNALVEKGIVKERVLTDMDSFPFSTNRLREAVATLKDLKIAINQNRRSQDPTFEALAAVVSHPKQSIPLLAMAYEKAAEHNAKTNYARILALLGNDGGAETLLVAVKRHDAWGKGWGLTSHRENNNTFSEVDRLVIALGFTRSPRAVPALVEKLKQLNAQSPLSHVKAVCLALRMNRGAFLTGPLADLLDEPGVSGHARLADYYRPPTETSVPRRPSTRATTGREPGEFLNAKFREVLLAALLFDCGDRDGKGRAILEAYTKDVHGHFAAYARTALDGRLRKSKVGERQ